MEVGSVVEWRKRDGDEVRAGEVLFTLQSDKAINEIEALDSGILRLPPDSPPPGVEVPIGTLLAYIVQPGEPAPFEIGPSSAVRDTGGAAGADVPRPRPAGTAETGSEGEAPRSPVVPSAAKELAAPGARRRGPAISPRARRVAAELGVRWAGLPGSGRTGRIVER